MIDKHIILKSIDDAISKCGPTIAEMKSQLSEQYGDDYDAMRLDLHEKNLFKSIYESRYFSDLYEDLRRYGYKSELTSEDKEDIKSIKEELFQMGRRLIEGLEPPNTPPNIDKSKYKEDTQFTGVWDRDSDLNNKIGEKEQKLIDAQEGIYSKDSDIRVESDEWRRFGYYTDFESQNDERVSMNEFFAGDSSHLNSDIYNKKIFKCIR